MHTVVKFETRYSPNKEPQDWVSIGPQGEGLEKTQTWHKVSTLIPDGDADHVTKESNTYKAQAFRWAAIKPEYDAWKAGAETPIDGLPLAAWPALDANQVDFLKKMGIRSVEDVRDMDDKTKDACRWPDAHRLPELAGKFLSGQDIAAKDAQIADMEERMKVLEEMLEQKPKRGRPPKKANEAA